MALKVITGLIKIYIKFIINLFNGLGLESSAAMIPRGIYYVEDVEYLFKEDPSEDYYIVVGRVIFEIDRNGLKNVLHEWKDEDYKHLEIKESEYKRYLRFGYEHNVRKEWLHVIEGGAQWY